MEEHQIIEHEHPVHEKPSVKKQIFLSLGMLTFLLLTTAIIILYGTGYRIGFQEDRPHISKTGILQLSSNPTGAQVYINNHLTSATNNDLTLTPGKYTVKISKDGYNDWQKDIEIVKECIKENLSDNDLEIEGELEVTVIT